MMGARTHPAAMTAITRRPVRMRVTMIDHQISLPGALREIVKV